VVSSVLGRHNVSNLLAVLEAAHILGLADPAVARAASGLRGAPGRFEVVPPADEVAVVVDYAHSPDGLEAVLRSAREVTGSAELWVVFGCGGDRDRLKRPLMGQVAATLADHVVLTTDNPRSEDPERIVAEIEAGFRSVAEPATLAVEMDRYNAIDAAISRAQEGDVILIAGKGHESTQIFADRTVPFEDRVAAAQSLRQRSLRRRGEDTESTPEQGGAA
jgi:UDP-N-acetylmuramoyl-L-alanyl-D-glutamate--2,6-diaminopimelate ligase